MDHCIPFLILLPQLDSSMDGVRACAVHKLTCKYVPALVMTQLQEGCSAHLVLSQDFNNDRKLHSMPNKSSGSSRDHEESYTNSLN